MKKNQRGITLIALVVTIIVLLILAGVAITLSIGDNGIFKRAGQATNAWEEASRNETEGMNSVVDIIDSINGGNSGGGSEKEERNKPNAPSLKTGMTPVKFNEATTSKKGEIVKTTKEDKDWYCYY